MALIPVIFNADDSNNTLKGKVQPEDLASFLSVMTSRTAGILDLFENPVGVSTIVDNTPVGKSTITFRQGYISVMGRLIYVQPNTQCQFTLPVAGTETGSFGIQIDLASTGANEVTWFKSTSGLRTDDIISNNASGVYQFRLYDYTATTTTLTLSNKTSEIIQKLPDYLKGANFETKPEGTSDKSLATTEFVQNTLTKYADMSITMQLFTETDLQVTHTWSGAGMLNKSNGKLYWHGNLNVYSGSNVGHRFNDVNTIRFRIQNITIDNKSYAVTNVKTGGIFSLRTDDQIVEAVLIGIYEGTSTNYSMSYAVHNPYNEYFARPYDANITGLLLEMQEI